MVQCRCFLRQLLRGFQQHLGGWEESITFWSGWGWRHNSSTFNSQGPIMLCWRCELHYTVNTEIDTDLLLWPQTHTHMHTHKIQSNVDNWLTYSGAAAAVQLILHRGVCSTLLAALILTFAVWQLLMFIYISFIFCFCTPTQLVSSDTTSNVSM